MLYRSSEKDCKNCPLRAECCGQKSKFKKISHSEYCEQYDRQHKKPTENDRYAKRMSRKRSAMVEPELGTLINFGGMKKIYARGIEQAEKHVLMASLCYNLRKMLKFHLRKSQVQVNYSAIIKKVQGIYNFACFLLGSLIIRRYKPSFF